MSIVSIVSLSSEVAFLLMPLSLSVRSSVDKARHPGVSHGVSSSDPHRWSALATSLGAGTTRATTCSSEVCLTRLVCAPSSLLATVHPYTSNGLRYCFVSAPRAVCMKVIVVRCSLSHSLLLYAPAVHSEHQKHLTRQSHIQIGDSQTAASSVTASSLPAVGGHTVCRGGAQTYSPTHDANA